MSNIPRHMQEPDLHQLFCDFGFIQDIQLVRRPVRCLSLQCLTGTIVDSCHLARGQDGTPKGSAFVVFHQAVEDAKRAKEEEELQWYLM